MNLGILGAGNIAGIMAQTIQMLNKSGCKDITLYAVSARELSRAQAFAAEYGVEKSFGSYKEMLQDPALDLVYIATPHSHHYKHIKLCAAHSKHILCEKAFTVNARQAEDAIRYAKAQGVLVTEAIWTRYQPMRQMIQQVLDEGLIGTPRLITANLCYPVSDRIRIADPALAGGTLLDVGVYTLNFAEMAFGPADGALISCTKNELGVDMTDQITLTWNDGRTAHLTAAVTVASDRSGCIYGDQGYLMVENINNPQSISVYDADHQLVKHIPCPAQFTGYEYEVLETVRCIREGKLECPSMPHSETIHMMELMDHLRAQMALHYPCEGLD